MGEKRKRGPAVQPEGPYPAGHPLRLVLKRFVDEDDPRLSDAARAARKTYPYDARLDAVALRASRCAVCKEQVKRGHARVVLMLQCYRGWKNQTFMHPCCLGKHPECSKVETIDEFVGLDEVDKSTLNEVARQLDSVKKTLKS